MIKLSEVDLGDEIKKKKESVFKCISISFHGWIAFHYLCIYFIVANNQTFWKAAFSIIHLIINELIITRLLTQVGQVEFKVFSPKENDYKCAYTIRRNYHGIVASPAHRFPPKSAETMKHWRINYIILPSHTTKWLMSE